MTPGHFCICPVDKIHNFSTFAFFGNFQRPRAREILLKIYKKFNYFSVFEKWIVTTLLNVVARRYDIYERSTQFLHIIIFSCEHIFMLKYTFLKICHYNLKVVWVDKCLTRVNTCVNYFFFFKITLDNHLWISYNIVNLI